MNCHRISMLGALMLLGTLQLSAMDYGEVAPNQNAVQLITVSKERIAAHKERWKKWEQGRTPYQNATANLGIIAGLAGLAYIGHHHWKAHKAAQAAYDLAPQADLDALIHRVTALEAPKPAAAPAAPAAAPVADASWTKMAASWTKTATSWVKGKASGGVSVAKDWGMLIVRGWFIGKGVSLLSRALLTSPIENKFSQATDYLFRPRTLLWLLKEDCTLKLMLENLRRIQDSAFDILRGDTTYSPRLIIGVNGLVREVEKVLGHMAFIEELLPNTEDYEGEREAAESATQAISNQLGTILKEAAVFIKGINDRFPTMEKFLEADARFKDSVWTSLDTIFEQMNLFEYVQRAVNVVDVSSDPRPLKTELNRMRAIIRPIKYGEHGEVIDVSHEDDMFDNLKEFLVKKSVEQVLEKAIPFQ